MEDRPGRVRPSLRIPWKPVRNALAEFVGTFLLVFIGTCNVAQFILTHEKLNTWIQINVGWGFAITFCVYVTHRSSGGQMNPAVSLLVWSFGHIDFVTFLVYCVAQTAGGFFGAAATYFFYQDAISHFDGGLRQVGGPNGTANVFASYPSPHLSPAFAYVDQAVGTGVLGLFVAAMLDPRNKIPKSLHPLLFGFLVMMIGMSFGMNVGYPINPARDFGPRLFTFFAYGSKVFQHPYPGYWIAPIVGPMIGCPLGAWLYHFAFGAHLDDLQNDANSYKQLDTVEVSNGGGGRPSKTPKYYVEVFEK